jgi:UDP-2,3-diacylglucosamine pyrophosphatase LpxH
VPTNLYQEDLRAPERIVVVSDIHMGPPSPRPLFRSQSELASLVRGLSSTEGAVDLIILGDALDYLAFAEDALTFARDVAVQKTDAILSANSAIFDALARFVARDKTRIVWSIGNHDIELAFSEVRERIETRVLGRPGRDPRLVWHISPRVISYDLAGGTVLRLVHGNEPDAWNRVNVNEVIKIAAMGGAADFVYPLGSRMVAKVLNVLKAQGYGHIDLLKPEESVALPLTLALWPDQAWPLVQAAAPLVARATLNEFVSAAFRPGPQRVSTGSEQHLDDAALLRDVLTTNGAEENVPGLQRASVGIRRTASWMLTRAAAKANAASQAFSVDLVDNVDREIIKTTQGFPSSAPETDHTPREVVVAGHTHLARSARLGCAHYFNTGTWAHLMKLPRNFDGRQMEWIAEQLKAAMENPSRAASDLRPFSRLTYVDVNLTGDGYHPFVARLMEHAPSPELAVVP